MDVKVCGICKQEKPLEEFAWRDIQKGRKHSVCRSCQKDHRKQHYEANKEKYVAKARRWNEENLEARRAASHQFVFEYLISHPCVDCGEKDPLVLEFDHVRGIKKSNVSKLMANDISLVVLKAEIEKCEVRCANCHRRRTALERNFWLVGFLEYNQKK